MEENWIQRVRNIAKQQAANIVDAEIVNHRMQLKRRDGQVIDAGPIKVKPPGALIVSRFDWSADENVQPDLFVSKDGAIWHEASSQGRYQGGPDNRFNEGCWTGDRFLLPYYVYSFGFSSVQQSRDGGTWNFHPDKKTFNNATNGNIHGMDALGTGLVLVVGRYLGEDETAPIVMSRDFGETFELVHDDPSIFPFDDAYGVTIKSDYEWIVCEVGGVIWYTRDGGLRWSEVMYPEDFQLENYYASGMRYFNGYWWLFGSGTTEGDWDTVLIKSEDLFTWVPVVTPWSGIYPLLEDLIPGPAPYGKSGYIENMEYDPSTNTIICTGSSPVTDSLIMMSTDGGIRWFEVGGRTSYSEDAIDAGYEGIYNWPVETDPYSSIDYLAWSFDSPLSGGLAYGYGWWFVSTCRSPDDITPMMLRISPSGRITEIVQLPHVTDRAYGMMLAGGDMNF